MFALLKSVWNLRQNSCNNTHPTYRHVATLPWEIKNSHGVAKLIPQTKWRTSIDTFTPPNNLPVLGPHPLPTVSALWPHTKHCVAPFSYIRYILTIYCNLLNLFIPISTILQTIFYVFPRDLRIVFMRSNRISNRIGRIYHASRNTV